MHTEKLDSSIVPFSIGSKGIHGSLILIVRLRKREEAYNQLTKKAKLIPTVSLLMDDVPKLGSCVRSELDWNRVDEVVQS